VNTLRSPKKPAFESRNDHLHALLDDNEAGPSSSFEASDDSPTYGSLLEEHRYKKMVRERSPTRASSGQYLSPQKTDRQPLANISAKMQSPSPKQPKDGDSNAPLKPAAGPEFGKASPLRNPLRKQPNIFIPKPKPVQKPSPPSQSYSQAPAQSQAAANTTQSTFYLPGQRAPAPAPQYSSALAAAQAYSSQPYQRSFEPDAVPVFKPANAAPTFVQPRQQPTFSSIGPNTYYQPYVPPKQVVDLTSNADDEDTFDPDAEIRANSRKFGEPDPFMYVDSSQANDNIKNLLEGAFDDDDDKPKTRLRKRAKKALDEGRINEAKGLSAKLAALDVKDEEKQAENGAEEEDEDEEDGTVEGLNVKLLPHQVEGVAWMIDKEIGQGKRMRGVLPRGGILADDMGLGKTVQSIALILTNARPGPNAKPEHPKQKLPGKEVSKCTLVVAPLALIKQWEDEIKTKVSKTHPLRVLVHHGASRTKSANELKKYDVVITTYQTLTSEHAGSNMDRDDGTRIGCFGVHWYRVLLDEAHSIKNRNAKATQAACALNAWYRWCLTGTPMQNNLDELQSLIKFLRIKPFCEIPEWKDKITQPMKHGRGGLAMKRLQVFLKACMKRRTKDILKKEGALNFGGKVGKEGEDGKPSGGMQIVKREVVSVECEFDDAEKRFYERLQNRADERLDEMSKKGKNDYIGALVILLRLRQACNHPRLVEMAMSKDKDAMTTGTGMSGSQTPRKGSKVDEGEMDALAALMGGVSVQVMQCDVCQVDLTKEEKEGGGVRCGECEGDLRAMREGPGKVKKEKVKKEKNVERKKVERPARNRRIVQDDSDEEGEGEWIGGGGEEQRVDLGKAGGTDDEDAEGGGETLDSIDSVRSADEEEDEDDSPPRAFRHRPAVKKADSDSDDSASASEASPSDSDASDSDSPAPILSGLQTSGKSSLAPSTKIRHLLRILHAEVPHHKVIIFSQFTSMLDLIEPHLAHSSFHSGHSGSRSAHSGLAFARYDGSMKPDAREEALSALRKDPKCRVLLCSLKCGSLGLNLTAASRVVIVEPFWNPFVEEQAIDRVHRLNQTVDVKVYRLTVNDTVEARILELQEKKRELAQAALEGGKAVGKLSMQDILSLFRHDGGGQGHEEDEVMHKKFGGDHRLLDGPEAGFEKGGQTGDMLRRVGEKTGRGEKPGRVGMYKEHDVFGRRW